MSENENNKITLCCANLKCPIRHTCKRAESYDKRIKKDKRFTSVWYGYTVLKANKDSVKVNCDFLMEKKDE